MGEEDKKRKVLMELIEEYGELEFPSIPYMGESLIGVLFNKPYNQLMVETFSCKLYSIDWLSPSVREEVYREVMKYYKK